MFRLGPLELTVIVAMIVLVFGPKRLPELGKGIGQFIKNFKSSIANGEEPKDKTSEKPTDTQNGDPKKS